MMDRLGRSFCSYMAFMSVTATRIPGQIMDAGYTIIIVRTT